MPDRRDILILGGLLLIAIGLGSFDWRIGACAVGSLLLALGLFYR